MISYRKILFFSIFQLLAIVGWAEHIKGGWMYYEYAGKADGKNEYKIFVKVYRDCKTPNPGQNDAAINITLFDNSNNGTLETISANQIDQYRLEKTSFSECISPRPEVCYVVLVYEGTVYLPENTEGYTASFQRCCRVGGIVNVRPPSNDNGNTYTIQLPGSNGGPGSFENNSPLFVEKDTVAVCYNSSFELDYGATDPDGDSLAYSFTSALVGGSKNQPSPTEANAPPYKSIPYAVAYSAGAPFGAGTVINPLTGLITGISPGTTGEYVLAVSVQEYRNGILIAETRKELHVNVAACSLVDASVLPITGTVSCDGFTIQYESASLSPNIHTYYWDFGEPLSPNNNSTLPKPSHTYADTGVYIAKLVVNREACTDSATTVIKVYPGFTPNFEIKGSCYASPFFFTDKTISAYGAPNYWRWNFGDPNTLTDVSSIKNPQYKYPTPGTYLASLVVSSSKGCLDSIQIQVVVTDKPLLILPFRDTLICSIDTLKLVAQGTGTFSWAPNNQMLFPNSANPLVWPKDTTTYFVSLNENGCTTTDSIKINVLDFITVNAGNDTTICRTDGIELHPVSDGLQYNWQPPTGLSNPKIKNPIATPLAATTTYTVNANLGKRISSDKVTITTIPYPVSKAGNDTTICYGEISILNGTVTGAYYSWQPSQLVQYPDQLNSTAFPKRTTLFILTVSDTLGCPKPTSDTVLVTMRPKIQVFAGNDTAVILGQVLLLHGTSNAENFLWLPTIGLTNPTSATPTVLINEGTLPAGQDEIRYLLTTETPEGCAGTDDILVKIFKTPTSIFLPSAFSPNGDGKNEVFKPILVGVTKLEYFRIFNRYGQLIFTTSEINKGWDGTINGQVQATSSYVFMCKAIDYKGKTLEKNGTFTLIR